MHFRQLIPLECSYLRANSGTHRRAFAHKRFLPAQSQTLQSKPIKNVTLNGPFTRLSQREIELFITPILRCVKQSVGSNQVTDNRVASESFEVKLDSYALKKNEGRFFSLWLKQRRGRRQYNLKVRNAK